jgi:hypothetical protein
MVASSVVLTKTLTDNQLGRRQSTHRVRSARATRTRGRLSSLNTSFRMNKSSSVYDRNMHGYLSKNKVQNLLQPMIDTLSVQNAVTTVVVHKATGSKTLDISRIAKKDALSLKIDNDEDVVHPSSSI